MKTCPSCRRANWVAESEPIGLFERGPMRWVFLRPFLCLQCRTRFRRFQIRSDSSPKRPPGDLEASFLKPSEDIDFKELVEKLKEAEKKLDSDRLDTDLNRDRSWEEVG